MEYKEYFEQLPINSNNVKIIDGVVRNDTANVVHATLMNGDKPFNFDGYTDIVLTVLLPTLNSRGENVRVVSRLSSQKQYNVENPYAITDVDPKRGRIDFTLTEGLTQEAGQYFAQIEILSAGQIVSTAKVNYRVVDALINDSPSENFINEDKLIGIDGLIQQVSILADNMSNWIAAEDERKTRETQRGEAEDARTEIFQDLSTQLNNMLATIRGDLEDAERFAELAREYSTLAAGPTKEAIRQALIDSDVALRSDVAEAIQRESVSDKTLGNFQQAMIYRIRQGAQADLPILAPGEFGFTNDKRDVYIGSNIGNIKITELFVYGNKAPDRTNVLWIDTANNNAIKFYNEDAQEWQPTATSVFS